MITIYLPAGAFRNDRPYIMAVLRQSWRDGYQAAFRYYYVEWSVKHG